MDAMMRLPKAALAVALLCSLVGGEAAAQFMGGDFSSWNNPISATANSVLMGQMHGKLLESSMRRKGELPAKEQPARVEVPLKATSFKPSGKRTLPGKLSASAAPEQRQQTKQLYNALMDGFEQFLEDNGEQRLRNNVAGALTFLVISSHYVLTDGKELDEAQSEAVLKDLNEALAGAKAFRKLSARGKQELYESFGMTGSLIITLYKTGQEEGDAEHVKSARELASSMLAQVLGRPLGDIRFTQGGIVIQ
jgi:hypothetical protein